MALEAAAAAAAPGIVGAGTKKESSGQGQSSDATGAGQQGETAAEREKEIRERFNIPEDVPIKSTAEALGFAKQVEALGGKLTPETWRSWKEKGSDEVVGKQVRETFGIPDDVPVGSIKDATDFARDVQMVGGKATPEVWRERNKNGNDAAITGILRENYEIPADAVVGGSKEIWDILRAASTVGDGRVTPEQWRDLGKRGKDAVIDGMIEDTFGVSKPGNMSREDLLKGLAEGDRLGVARQDRPSFIQDWDRQRNGGITLDELLNKWMPGARAGIDRGGLPGGGLPGGPGSGGSGLPGGGLPGGPGGGGSGLPGLPTGPGGPGGGGGRPGA